MLGSASKHHHKYFWLRLAKAMSQEGFLMTELDFKHLLLESW